MKQPLSLSIFFPAYNEEANIAESVREAEKVAKKITPTYEIIVVDDGSRDKTGAIIDDLAKKDPDHIRAIHHNPNQGYGAAVWTGMRAAKYDYVFFTDADLQFNLQELAELVKHVDEYDVVLGYRAKRKDPFMRLVNAKSWNLLNRVLFGLKVKDIDCAFKLFKREVIQELPVKSKGAMLSAEFLIRLQRQGIKFKEVPVTHLPRTQGSPTGAKPKVIIRAFKEMGLAYMGDLGNQTQKQFIKFSLIGLKNTVVDYVIYFGLTRFIPFFNTYKVATKAFSYLIAGASSFAFNRRWTFRKKSAIRPIEVVQFYAVIIIGDIINASVLHALLPVFHGFDVPAVICATACSYAWNFTVTKFWVFKAHLSDNEPDPKQTQPAR